MKKTDHLEILIWSTLPMLLNASRLLGDEGTRIFALAALLWITFSNLLLKPALSYGIYKAVYKESFLRKIDPGLFLITIALSALLVITYTRALGTFYTANNWIANTGMQILLPVALLASLSSAPTIQARNRTIYAILLSLPIYVVANVLLHFGGLSSNAPITPALAEDSLNQTLALIGLSQPRVEFPLTYGTNIFGSISAASTLICFFFITTSKKISGKAVFGFGLIFCLTALILTDARAATAATLLSAAIAIWICKRPGRAVYVQILIIIIPLMPFLAHRVFYWLNNATTFSFLIRPGELGGRLGVGTGRGYIWASFESHFFAFDWQHIFGYGAFGHMASNVSVNYSWIFNTLGNTQMGAHNAFLQYLVDSGYVGATIWITFLFVLTKKLAEISIETPKHIQQCFMGLILLILIQSQTENTGTLYSPELTYFLISSAIIASFLIKSYPLIPSIKNTSRHMS